MTILFRTLLATLQKQLEYKIFIFNPQLQVISQDGTLPDSITAPVAQTYAQRALREERIFSTVHHVITIPIYQKEKIVEILVLQTTPENFDGFVFIISSIVSKNELSTPTGQLAKKIAKLVSKDQPIAVYIISSQGDSFLYSSIEYYPGCLATPNAMAMAKDHTITIQICSVKYHIGAAFAKKPIAKSKITKALCNANLT